MSRYNDEICIEEVKDRDINIEICDYVTFWSSIYGDPSESSSLVKFLNKLLDKKQDLIYYIVDTEADKEEIPDKKVGTLAFVKASRNIYVYSNEGDWIPLIQDLSIFYTKDETDALLELKADIDKVYSKIEADALFATLENLAEEKAERVYADNEEIRLRAEADLLLQANINAEANIREADISDLHDLLDDEARNREQSDNEIKAIIQAEKEEREQAGTEFLDLLEAEKTERRQADETLQENINTEADYRFREDVFLNSKIDDEIVAREEGDRTNRALINAEVAQREAEDRALKALINEETVQREAEDRAIRTLISEESAQREEEHNVISQRINNLDTRELGHYNSLNAKDIDLQEQIDAIVASSDVKDIVGTYAKLQAYDKSKLGDNDLIQVMKDETRNNETTIYRFKKATGTFVYEGSYGSIYTKAEVDGLLNEKADVEALRVTIQNVDALTGEVENITGEISTYGDIVTHNTTEFLPIATRYGVEVDYTQATNTLTLKDQNGDVLDTTTIIAGGGGASSFSELSGSPYDNTALAQALNSKQAELVSGTNIKTINNQSILGDGNLEVAGASSFSELSGSPYDNTALASALNSKQSESDVAGQISTHNASTSAHTDIRQKAESAEALAKGAQQAVSFASYQAMVTAVNAYDKDKFTVGQSVYIVTREVPDLWVSAKFEETEEYTYTTDQAIVDALNTTGNIRVGYYQLSALETGKVNIDNMVTTDTAQTISGSKDFTGSLTKSSVDVATVDDITLKGVQVNGTDLVVDANKKVNVPVADNNTFGVMKPTPAYGLSALGNNVIGVSDAKAGGDALITAKANAYRPLTPRCIDLAVKTGITTNTLTLTDEEKTNAKNWLGVTPSKTIFRKF